MSDTHPREAIMNERIRMSKVRKSLGACLEEGLLSDQQAEAYYEASVHYLQSALDRLHTQDQRIIDLLHPLVPSDQEADRQILASFDRSLSRSRVALDRFVLALENFQIQGLSGREQFEREARAFLEVFINILAARRHTSSHLEDTHFSDEDWVFVADTSPEALQRESELYAAVKRLAPEKADPDQFVAGPPPQSGE